MVYDRFNMLASMSARIISREAASNSLRPLCIQTLSSIAFMQRRVSTRTMQSNHIGLSGRHYRVEQVLRAGTPTGQVNLAT